MLLGWVRLSADEIPGGRAAVSLGKYHSPLVRSNEMKSTSGTPLGMLRLGRQRPLV